MHLQNIQTMPQMHQAQNLDGTTSQVSYEQIKLANLESRVNQLEGKMDTMMDLLRLIMNNKKDEAPQC